MKGALAKGDALAAGLAKHSRTAFEVHKAYQKGIVIAEGISSISAAYKHGTLWGGPLAGAAQAAIAAAFVAAQLAEINATSFGGGGSGSVGGGGVPSMQTPTAASREVPATAQAAPQKQDINLTISGLATLRAGDLIDSTLVRDKLIPEIISGIKDGVAGANINLVYS